VKELEARIQHLLTPIAERKGAFVVDIGIRHERGGKVIQAFVDTDKGISIEECAEISRELSRELASVDFITGDYGLEISSPGLDRPLKLLRQYQKNIGRIFKVRYAMGAEKLSIRGTLRSLEGTDLLFESENGESVRIPFESILESKEELPW
jgi:ribosome maturation factor RimP